MLAELAEVVRLRGVKCPVSAGPGGFRINTVYNGLKLILNNSSSFLSHALSQDFCEAILHVFTKNLRRMQKIACKKRKFMKISMLLQKGFHTIMYSVDPETSWAS